MNTAGRHPTPPDDPFTKVEDERSLPSGEELDPEVRRDLMAELAGKGDPELKDRLLSQRESVRTGLSIAIVSGTGAVGIATIVAAAANLSQAALVQSVFTAMIGLSGTVLGFYFGGKETRI